MRISKILSGEFIPSSNTLRIDGQDESGSRQSIEIDVANRTDFVGWITMVLFESAMSEENSSTGLVAKKVGFSTHGKPGVGSAVGFTFELTNGGTLRLVLPIADVAKTRLDAIQAHLEQALKEMGATNAVHKQ